MSHPDEAEAREWVQREVSRLRSLPYEELRALVDEPTHYDFTSATRRSLMGETSVFWDDGTPGPIRVIVDVCEPKRGLVRSIAAADFIKAADGSFVGE